MCFTNCSLHFYNNADDKYKAFRVLFIGSRLNDTVRDHKLYSLERKKGVEGSSFGLVWGFIPAFAWQD